MSIKTALADYKVEGQHPPHVNLHNHQLTQPTHLYCIVYPQSNHWPSLLIYYTFQSLIMGSQKILEKLNLIKK